jgi:hypothetical protein
MALDERHHRRTDALALAEFLFAASQIWDERFAVWQSSCVDLI